MTAAAPIRIPLLRQGRAYHSLKTVVLPDVRSGQPVAAVSQAHAGLISRDLRDLAAARRSLAGMKVSDLIAICRRAADGFMAGDLPLDDGVQSPADYVRQLSSTTGMPEVLCRANMEKIRFVLAEMERVLAGLTRGLDLGVLDSGHGREDDRTVSYLRQADAMGAVLPGNSPGVHSLWLPAIPLKVALVLRPGRQEPWTPYRIAQALMAAGCPAEALGFYPSDHAGAAEILLRCCRSMLFGDAGTVRPWLHDPRVQLHGPGWSKVILGEDQADAWKNHLDLMASSVADNGGRSCINASGIRTPRHGRALAQALAEKLAALTARPLDHPEAGLAAFAPRQAQALSSHIDRLLEVEGAEDVSTAVRGSERLVVHEGLTFLLPTVIYCSDADHPLASAEYLFPFVSVVESPVAGLLEQAGPTLVATVLSDDAGFRARAMDCRHLERLNLGALPTSRVSWDQPHEGNLFDHLYRQRAYQSVAGERSDAA